MLIFNVLENACQMDSRFGERIKIGHYSPDSIHGSLDYPKVRAIEP